MLEAAAHEHRIVGCRRQQHIYIGICQGFHLEAHVHASPAENVFDPHPICQAGTDGLINGSREGNRPNVDDLHAAPGDDEFPAGRHYIITRIVQIITMLHQSRDDHIVIAVLGEPQSLAGQLARQAEQIQVGLGRNAQVDLRVDQLQVTRHPQHHAG